MAQARNPAPCTVLDCGFAAQLKPLGIVVSVLCPRFVRTRIGESGRNR
jgi:hypothetical protein